MGYAVPTALILEFMMKKTTLLRRLLAEKDMLVAPFCYEAVHAKLAEHVGFHAVYMTGYGVAASLGFPDVGLVTQTEMIERARYLASAVDVPLICDADTGYGEALNVWRTVRDYEAAGVAAIHLEDQVSPKRCGFLEGKQVISAAHHAQKIRAAVDAKTDPDFVIIARTDALAVNGWDDVVSRCTTYMEAGADLVFVDGIKTAEDLAAYAHRLPNLPKVYNGWLAPTSTVDRLGFKLMITCPIPAVIYRSVKDAFEELKATGSVSESRLANPAEVHEFMGVPKLLKLASRYSIDD